MNRQHPALAYAESLGYQAVYTQAIEAHRELDKLFVDLDKAQDERRMFVDRIADREVDILIHEQGLHPEWSANRMEQHMKVAKRQDPALGSLRKEAGRNQAWLSGLEIDKEVLSHTIRIREARMIELGGVFNYLAAVKQAETSTKTTAQEIK